MSIAPRAFVAAAILGAAVAAGCGSDEPSRAPVVALRPCTIDGVAARCGAVRVPENPRRPRGRTIPIRIAVVPARDGDPAPDPLVYLAGWGSAGIEDDLAAVVPMLEQVNRHRDLVFVDQRGTGGSNRLACRLPAGPTEAPVRAATATATARRCAAAIGPGLRFYTTAVAMDDLDAVRRALRADEVNLYGGSYGGTAAQVYLARHGDHVRTVTLDGASLLDVRIFERAGANAQRALELLFARCRADPACHAAFPDPEADLRRIEARVARAPLAVAGLADGVGPLRFADALDGLLAPTESKTVIPLVLRYVAAGRIGEVASALRPVAEPTDELAYKMLIQCSEPWASWRPRQVARASAGSFLEPVERRNAAVVRAACRGFPRGVAPAWLGARVRSDVPVLILTGDEDPADPPANVAGARRELPNSRTVIFPAGGHGQLRLPCAQDLIATVVDRGTTAGIDATCARTAAARPFVLSP